MPLLNIAKVRKRYHWLDLVRFLSSFLVLAAHYRGASFVDYHSLPASQQNILTFAFFFLTRLGQEPVMIFFMLSGYLVGGKAIERILTGGSDVATYALDRSVRILLPLAASMIWVMVVYLIIGEKLPYADMLGAIFSLQGVVTNSGFNVPLWSLSYEVWFYILMGAIMVICKRGKRKSTIGALLSVAIFLLVFTKLSLFYLLVWLMGAFTYLLPKPQKRPSGFWVVVLSVLLILAIGLAQITTDTHAIKSGIAAFLSHDVAEVLFAIIACLFIDALVNYNPQTKFSKALDDTGTKLAAFSYTLYLTHIPLLRLLFKIGWTKNPVLNFYSVSMYIAALVLALVCALLIYQLTEKHTDSVKKTFKAKFMNN